MWLMVAAGVGYVSSLIGYAVTAARKFSVQVPLFALVAGSSGALSLWLVPAQGLRGAAFAVLGAAIVQLVGSLGIIFSATRIQDGDAHHDG
jgi:hypothetical protein